MIKIPVYVDGQACYFCGQPLESLTINVRYVGNSGGSYRANRANPCGCLTAVASVTLGIDSIEVKRYQKVRH